MKPSTLALSLLFAGILSAQTTTSIITGVVQDSSGAVIPGAQVQITNEESGLTVPATTNQVGLYRVPNLYPGVYRVAVEAPGFQHLVRSGITLQIAQTLQLDLTLELGNVQETVTVTGDVPLLETQSATVSQLVDRDMVQGMPMPNRTSTALIALIPGAAVRNVTGDIPQFAAAGGRMRNQQFTLDGGNHTNTVGLAVNQSQVPLPMDAMQEFRVIMNTYSAEYGQSQSGVVTLATRAGTNAFHGSVFEYWRNEALDARNFFAATRPKYRQNQFGGSLGGPIIKDRTHFFVTYERTQQVTGGTAWQTVPTPLQRGGDFSQTFNGSGKLIRIYDPATTSGNVRTQFPNNQVPIARFDTVAANAVGYWPDPNQPGSITGANNFSANTRPTQDRDILIGRVDHQFSESDQLMVRYFIADTRNRNPGIWSNQAADPSATRVDQRTHNLLGSWTHILRPNLTNEVRLGFVRRDYFQQREIRGDNFASQLGLQGVSDAAFPIFTLTGFQALSGAPFRFSSPLLDYQVQDGVSWFRNKHAIKIGVESRFGVFNDDRDTSSSGNFAFTPLLTGLPGTSGTGNAMATFLLGEANSANIIRADPIRSKAAYWGAYIQDDWRIHDRLTVNLGLRWEGTTPRTEVNDRMNSFDPNAINPVSGTPGVITFAGRNGVPRTAWDFDGNNFGPRIGIAWRPRERTVIRTGIGVIYGAAVNEIVGTAAALGFSTDLRVSATQPGFNSALLLRDGFPTLPRLDVDQLDAGFGAVPVGKSPNTSVDFFERSRPTPISYQYNFGIQQQLATNLTMEVNYMGNLSHHLTAPAMSINQVPTEKLGPGNAQVLRPYPQFSNVSVLNPPLGNSAYHAGVVKIERRYRGGLSLLAHYTFSKYLDDVASFTEFGDPGSYQDFYNRGLDRGRSGSDIRHRGVVSAVWQVPLFVERGLLSTLFGGWKTGTIASWQSGPPFTVYSSVNQTNAFPPGSVRADLIGDPELSDSARGIDQWFNTGAFAVPAPYRFGTAGRSIVSGPGSFNIDQSFIKNFQLNERFGLQLRAEFFNLLNRANFNLPGRSVGTPAFGIINSAQQGRSGQLAVRLEF
jgi:hypothetical protein